MTTAEDTTDWAPEPEEYAVIEAKLKHIPRLFALCELERDEEGELVDGGVLAWGMAFDHRAELVSSDGSGRGSFGSADRAARLFSPTGEVRLVWPEPVAAWSVGTFPKGERVVLAVRVPKRRVHHGCYRPRHWGGRFSAKARGPSSASAERSIAW